MNLVRPKPASGLHNSNFQAETIGSAEILAHIDPVGAVVHALVADVVDIIDDDEREDDRRSDDDVAIDEVSDDSDVSPKSPEIIALSDTDGDDDWLIDWLINVYRIMNIV